MSHIDHTGLLPIFNDRNGFKGTIYSSYETQEIARDLLKDSTYIHSKNVEYLKGKGDRVEMLYTEPDLYNMFTFMKPMDVNKEVKLDENLTIELRYNSHVVGSCNATIKIRKPNTNRIFTIVYSSDLGNEDNLDCSDYLKKQDLLKKCDIFISEGTYSAKGRDVDKSEIEKERKELLSIIKEGITHNRRILIPTFAFGRSQQVATFLWKSLKDEEWFVNSEANVIMDGCLMNNINRTYSRVLKDEDKIKFDSVMEWDKLKRIEDYKSTLSFLSKRTPSIILASSGFMQAGRVLTYLPTILGSSQDVIINIGYCSQDVEGSMGYKLLNDNIKRIEFEDKKVINKNATIYQQRTWSSHISHKQLLDLFASLNCGKIIIHHCDKDNKEEFGKEIKEYLRSKNKTTPVVFTSKCANQFVL